MPNPLATVAPPNAIVARRKPGRPPKHIEIEADFTPPDPGIEPSFSEFISFPDPVVRERYAKTLDKNEALNELGRLRKLCEIAAQEINQRLIPDESKCLICDRELPRNHKVAMMANVKDDASGIITTHPICSLECVRQYNKRRMGLSQIPDQAHVKESA